MLLWLPENTEAVVAEFRGCRRVVIATGILGGGPIFDELLLVCGTVPVLVVTGCGGGLTRRESIERLRRAGAEVHVVDDRTGGLFHAKVYAMEREHGAVFFVGSANLSNGGFAENREAVLRIEQPTIEIDALASRLRAEGPLLDDLDGLPTPPRATGRFQPAIRERIPLSTVLRLDWTAYVDAVLAMDGWWKQQDLAVFAEAVGWLPTIDALLRHTQRELVTLSNLERRILVGQHTAVDFAYFGDIDATPQRHLVLDADAPERHQAVSTIDLARRSVGEVGAALTHKSACDAFDRLTAINGVWLGVASRLLLSVRPDVFVSVNRGSRQLLEEETGLSLPAQANRSRASTGYHQLLARVQAAPWWSAPCPKDANGAEIWRARAALIDVFVYQAVSGD